MVSAVSLEICPKLAATVRSFPVPLTLRVPFTPYYLSRFYDYVSPSYDPVPLRSVQNHPVISPVIKKYPFSTRLSMVKSEEYELPLLYEIFLRAKVNKNNPVISPISTGPVPPCSFLSPNLTNFQALTDGLTSR